VGSATASALPLCRFAIVPAGAVLPTVLSFGGAKVLLFSRRGNFYSVKKGKKKQAVTAHNKSKPL